MKTKQKPTTAADVRTALRVRFAAPAFAMFEEVGNSTGFRTSRHADAVAIGIWPSRGYTIEGVEIKVSRSDWLSELKNPKKADEIAKYCDRWWVAVGDDSIVKEGELPPTWGLLVLRGEKLVQSTQAPMLKPEPAPRAFLAAILRRAHEGIQRQCTAAKAEGIAIGQASGPEEHAAKLARKDEEIGYLKEAISTFEEKSGLKINRWEAGPVGEAVKELMALRLYGANTSASAELEKVANWIEGSARRIREELERTKQAEAIARRDTKPEDAA